MSKLFLSVLNMSLMASYVILCVILVRLLLKKAPKVISYALWSVVAVRLIFPFSMESVFSLLPRKMNTVPIPHDIIYQQSPKINSGIEVVDSFVNSSLPAPVVGESVNPLQIYTEIGAYVWVLGITTLLVYSLVSVLILKRQLKSAQLIEKNIFEAKNLKTPFVLGFLRPQIYLPAGLSDTERRYILIHEQIHINRKDHIIKILAFLILSIHWFNPLVWIAFMLMSTDMELSCDEKVLKEMNEDIKKPYASSLLSLAAERHILSGNPLAFGEGNVKSRIKNVLSYKEPSFWIIISAVIIAVIISIGLLTNPKNDEHTLNNEIISAGTGEEGQGLSPAESSVSYTLIKLANGEVVHTISPLSGDNAKLAQDVIMNYLIRSVLWPGVDIRTLKECYLLRATYSDGTSTDYYVYLHNGRTVLQREEDGFYSYIDDKLYERLVKLMESSTATVGGVDGPQNVNVTMYTNIEPAAPEWSPEQSIGAGMAELDFASDDLVIFHGYFGLFVYDLNSLQIIRSIDLKPLNCHQTQGDNYCDVSVSMNGDTVQLHPMGSTNMYVYTVSSHTLQQTAYTPMVNSFKNKLVPIEEATGSTGLGNYSYHAFKFDTGEYGYLHTSDWTLGTLSYVRGDMRYDLFG
jgi:beta-lactamase regulating signal transducer with metallopeptidase domain